MMSLQRLLSALESRHVESIIVGGVAAALHGSARLTQDLDVVYSRTPRNLHGLVEALKPHKPCLRGAPPDLPFRLDQETLRRGLNFTLTTDLGNLDLLGEIAGGGGYADLVRHVVEFDAFGFRLRCLDLDTLIEVKMAAGRPRDFEQVAELRRIRGEQDSRRR